MAKKRIFEVAKDIGVSAKELVETLQKMGVEAKSHMSSVEESVIEKVLDKLTASATKPAESKPKLKKTTAKIPSKEIKGESKAKVKTEVKAKKEETKKTEIKKDIKKEELKEEKPKEPEKKIKVVESITIAELSAKIKVPSSDIIRKMISSGWFVTINQNLNAEALQVLGKAFNVEFEIVTPYDDAVYIEECKDPAGSLVPRPPVITIMGHVDHGKTTLLDSIRETNVTASEAGGITQHIGAYVVNVQNKQVTFLDTPGHAAFTSLRARGAQVTDLVILIVAADDGVMPQTIEALNHAKAAGVPILVAVNKIDRPTANPDKVKQELYKHGLVSEEWGGKTIFVEISAMKKIGLDHLIEMILLEAELLELKANSNCPARGTIIEAKIDRGRGPVATVLIQKGTLKIGDIFVSGTSYGKVRAMINDKGKKIDNAGPSIPVEVLGFTEVPVAGDSFVVVSDEKFARQISLKRSEYKKQKETKYSKHITLDDLFSEIQKGTIKELKIIIKADVVGSMEALVQSFEQLSSEKVKLTVIHGGVGDINESDIMLASASNAIIIGFHVKADAKSMALAENEKVDVRIYKIIYEAIDSVKLAMEGLLEPKYKEITVGEAEIRQVIQSSQSGAIIGVMVTKGKLTRGNDMKIFREGKVVYEGRLNSLKRFKEDVKEVLEGYECGIKIEETIELKERDQVKVFTLEKEVQKL